MEFWDAALIIFCKFINHGLNIQVQCISQNFTFALKCSASSSEVISEQNLMAAMVIKLRQTAKVFV